MMSRNLEIVTCEENGRHQYSLGVIGRSTNRQLLAVKTGDKKNNKTQVDSSSNDRKRYNSLKSFGTASTTVRLSDR